ncbi:MAG TPA: hypothetical protein VMV68_01375 [Spirochaetia bacterium]|nr:hypothetical protein [Spirochaetia bacterium]
MASSRAQAIAVLFVLVSSVAAFGSDSTLTTSAVDHITNHCLQIDNTLNDYECSRKDFTIDSGYGVMTAYGPHGSPVKIVVQVIGDAAGEVTEFYLTAGELIYVVRARQLFGRSADSQGTTLTEDRYFLEGGHLLRWIERTSRGMTSVESEPSAPGSLGTELCDSVRRWRDFLASPLDNFNVFSASVSP